MKLFVKVVRVSVVVAGLALLVAGCGKKTASDVLARVGDQAITIKDFEAELQYRIVNRQPVPDREALLNEMIERTKLVQRAKAAGLENAADVHRTFENVLIAKLKETELDSKLAEVKISPEEIHAAYEKDVAHFTQPAKAQLAFVYLKADSKWETNQLAEVAARADEAHRLALTLPAAEKGFGQVAANFSEDQISRYRGGDGGWFTADFLANRWPQEVITAGLALKNIGQLSDVIRAPDGFYLVKKMDARPAVVTPLEQAQSAIERHLLTVKRERLEEEFRHVAIATVVETNLQLLSHVDYPTQSTVNVAAVPPSLPASP